MANDDVIRTSDKIKIITEIDIMSPYLREKLGQQGDGVSGGNIHFGDLDAFIELDQAARAAAGNDLGFGIP